VSEVEDLECLDPAIARFLVVLEKDIEDGRNIRDLPDGLASSMMSALNRHVDEEIYGNIEI
jgi:antitoxin PrlF